MITNHTSSADRARILSGSYALSELDPAAQVFYIAWDSQREEAAESDPSLELCDDQASRLYRYVLSIWADRDLFNGTENVVLEECGSEIVVTVDGRTLVSTPSSDTATVPRVTTYLQAALRAHTLPISTYEPSEDYVIDCGTMRVHRADTPDGNTLPVKMVLERAF